MGLLVCECMDKFLREDLQTDTEKNKVHTSWDRLAETCVNFVWSKFKGRFERIKRTT